MLDRMYRIAVVGLPALLIALTPPHSSAAARTAQGPEVLRASGVRGGLIVHLGCGEPERIAALRANDRCLVHGLDTDAARVAKAREVLKAKGLYGPVSVDRFDGRRLPYAGDMVSLLVAEELARVPMAEAMRVLAPGGSLCVRKGASWTRTVKPRPEAMDDWTHYLHGADNNAVSNDRLVAPPRHLQWAAEPLWPRSHEYTPSMAAMVSAGGKIFYLHDDGIRGIMDKRLPERWALYARDAFNGLLLWKVPVTGWGPREWKHERHWHTPLSLPRRLVAVEKRVYVTLGYRAPVSVLDADTGAKITVFKNTHNADEILWTGGKLILRQRKIVPDYPPGAGPWNIHVRAKTGKKTSPALTRLPPAEEADQAVLAIDDATGRLLWRADCKRMVTLSLAASGKHVCYHNFEEVVCLSIQDGKELWRAKSESWPDLTGTSGSLVMHGGVVLYSGDRGLQAWDAPTGRLLWKGPRIARTTIRHPPDLFVANGLLWGGLTPQMPTGKIPHEESPNAGKPMSGKLVEGLDPKTGKVKRQLEIGALISPGHHVRCYRAKATQRFLLWPKRGVEFVDIAGGTKHERCNWFRGECSYGVMPANGLIYAPPHPCLCNLGVVLTGFNALAAQSKSKVEDPRPEGPRLEKGPAYDTIVNRQSSIVTPQDWPTYRHDPARSGCTASAVSGRLSTSWTSKLGGRLTAPVVAGGSVYVAVIDAHTLYALNGADGKVRWHYTAGARVDTPPTIHGRLVLAGCRDGWVYCLRASDGEMVWRFRAAPRQRRIVCFGQLESAWPVPGSILVQNGVAYFAAGRSGFLDGGITLYGLSPATGKVLHRHHFDGPWPDIRTNPGWTFHMEGAKADVLTTDGKSIFLMFQRFDLKLNKLPTPRAYNTAGDRSVGLHLMARNGFLDTTWFDRTSWTYSKNWSGRYFRSGAPKAGQILVFDRDTTYALQVFSSQLFMSPKFTPGTGYLLRADDNRTELRGGRRKKAKPTFSLHLPIRARAMALAGGTLFLAGAPDVLPKDDPYAALEGRRGAKLWAVSAQDGAKFAEYGLDAPPVPDGMAAVPGRLVISCIDGAVRCLAGAGTPPR